jgi:hypothetical protein
VGRPSVRGTEGLGWCGGSDRRWRRGRAWGHGPRGRSSARTESVLPPPIRSAPGAYLAPSPVPHIIKASRSGARTRCLTKESIRSSGLIRNSLRRWGRPERRLLDVGGAGPSGCLCEFSARALCPFDSNRRPLVLPPLTHSKVRRPNNIRWKPTGARSREARPAASGRHDCFQPEAHQSAGTVRAWSAVN